MLHLFLVILKIIGIALAVIIGLLLLLVLAVLFVPFYYQAEGGYNSLSEEKNPSLKGKVSFLGPFLNFKFWYGDKFEWDIKLFFFSLKKFIVKRNGKNEDSVDEFAEEFSFEKPLPSDESELISENVLNEIENESGKTLAKKIEDLKQKIKAFFKKVKDTFSKVKSIYHSLQELLEDERFKAAFVYAKDEVFAVLKKIWPHIQYMDIHYGLEDPALTGQILGAVSVMNGMTGTTISMNPDFETEKAFFDGKGKIKGKIIIFYLLKLWYKYKCDREIKYLKYKIKKVRRSF